MDKNTCVIQKYILCIFVYTCIFVYENQEWKVMPTNEMKTKALPLLLYVLRPNYFEQLGIRKVYVCIALVRGKVYRQDFLSLFSPRKLFNASVPSGLAVSGWSRPMFDHCFWK